jgi:hypothetical protein
VGHSEQEAMVEQTQYLLGALDILSETDIFVGSYRCDLYRCNVYTYIYIICRTILRYLWIWVHALGNHHFHGSEG